MGGARKRIKTVDLGLQEILWILTMYGGRSHRRKFKDKYLVTSPFLPEFPFFSMKISTFYLCELHPNQYSLTTLYYFFYVI